MAGQANGGQVVPPRRNSMNGGQMGGSNGMVTMYGGNRNRGGNPKSGAVNPVTGETIPIQPWQQVGGVTPMPMNGGGLPEGSREDLSNKESIRLGRNTRFGYGGGMSNMNGGFTPLPGGGITNQMPAGFTGGGGGRAITPWTNSVTGETWNAPSTGFTPPSGDWQHSNGQKFTGGLPRPATSSPSPGTQQPANINTLAAEGIKAAGAATGQGLSFNPQQVSVAGSSASVNPTNVVGSDVVNANVVGSNITANQIAQQNASPQVMAERLSNTDMSQYMNPYTDQVISANERDTRRAADMGLDMLGAQAQAAGGFGGSRHGIAMGEIGRGLTDTLGRQSAGLRQAGYQNAQQMAGQDITNNFQSQMANQQGGQFDINTNMAAQRANQAANLQASQQNQQNALQAALANQSAGMQSGLANQGNALQAAGMNQSYNMQGQLANQQAGQQDIQNRLQAALANQGASLQGNQQRLGAANQLGNISNLGFNMGQTVNNNLWLNKVLCNKLLQQASI